MHFGMDSRGYFLVDSSSVAMPTPWIQFLLQCISGNFFSKISTPPSLWFVTLFILIFGKNVLPFSCLGLKGFVVAVVVCW